MTVSVISDPLSLDTVKLHLQVDFDEDDTMIQAYMTSSLHLVQNYTSKNAAYFDVTEDFLRLENTTVLAWTAPVAQVTVTYTDTSLNTKTLVVDVVDNVVYIETLPADYDGGVVTMKYTPIVDVQLIDIIKQIRLLIIGDWYIARENTVMGTQVNELKNTGVKTMLDSIKSGRV